MTKPDVSLLQPILPFLCSALITLAAFSSIRAQSEPNIKLDGGTGGRNTLQGDIYTPHGGRLDKPILVRLVTNRGEISTTTNGNGVFVFRQLMGGRYTVRIDAGEPYAPALEVVEIMESAFGGQMSRPGQLYTVQVHLRLRENTAGHPGVVSAKTVSRAAIDLFEKAIVSAKDGKRDQAIEQLKAAIEIQPDFVEALNGLGVQYMRLGKYEPALDAFERALRLAPESFILHLNCGIALVRLRKFAEAEKELGTAILQNAGSGSAHLYRARALIGLNRLDEAARDLKRAIEIGGEEVKTAHRYLAGIYIEKGKSAEAVKELELYLKSMPDSKESDQIKALLSQLKKPAPR